MKHYCQECGRRANYHRAGQRTRARADHSLCSRCWSKATEQANIDKRAEDIAARTLTPMRPVAVQ